jgi:hypothetical protein
MTFGPNDRVYHTEAWYEPEDEIEDYDLDIHDHGDEPWDDEWLGEDTDIYEPIDEEPLLAGAGDLE